MQDKNPKYPPRDNIKGLVQDLVEVLDARMRELIAGTGLDSVRPSDAKTFMLAARHPRSISDIAKALSISRQAAHASVGRLGKKGVVKVVTAPGNQRNKIVMVTNKGHEARRRVAEKLQSLEAELATRIGADRLEILREILLEIVDGYRQGGH